jgi:hypothetical protein
MKSIGLIFGTHNYLPRGTPAEVVEHTYQKAYKPFLSLLYKYPRIQVALHYCGSMFEWLETNHPEFIMLLKEMVRRKQVELLGGGYYAPVLAILPDVDKLGQIEKMSTFLRTTFGTRPRGGWIMERVWEPGLARVLRNSGMEYTFLDDRHFHTAGVPEKECYQAYLTEDQGKTLAVLPLHITLQKMIPGNRPEELVMELHGAASPEKGRIAVIMLQGEELGGCVEKGDIYSPKGWLPAFFDLLEQNRQWLHPVSPRFAPRSLEPLGRLYFPCVSSAETMCGVLSVRRQKVFRELSKKVRRQEAEAYLRGGFFRQFITKYPEISLLYSRLMYTHILVGQIRGDKYRKKAAQNELWKGQTGAVYWHGNRGGAYANHLRKAAYQAFIEAERVTRGAQMFVPSIIATDFDLDGEPEYLYQGKVLNAFVHRIGACLIELDYLPRRWNYLDTIARWPEPDHRFKYEGCDWYIRKGFLDHFFAPNTTLQKFDRMSFHELGDFLDQPFELEELKRDQRTLVLVRTGKVRVKRRSHSLTVRKRYRFKENGIEVTVGLVNDSGTALELWYGLEMNLALADRKENSAALVAQLEGGEKPIGTGPIELAAVNGVRIHDRANGVLLNLAAERLFLLWSLPVETVCYRGSERETIYQSSCLVASWPLSVQPGQEQEFKLTLDLRKS